MPKLIALTLTSAVALGCSPSFAAVRYTQVNCGGLNEAIQVTRSYAAGTASLSYAELLTMILGDKAAYGWPEGRPMPTNRYIGADIKSVEAVTLPAPFSAGYLVTITSKNHVPETRVLCSFEEMDN
jgi:hypothetical protein